MQGRPNRHQRVCAFRLDEIIGHFLIDPEVSPISRAEIGDIRRDGEVVTRGCVHFGWTKFRGSIS